MLGNYTNQVLPLVRQCHHRQVLTITTMVCGFQLKILVHRGEVIPGSWFASTQALAGHKIGQLADAAEHRGLLAFRNRRIHLLILREP